MPVMGITAQIQPIQFSGYYLLTIPFPLLAPDLQQGLFIFNEPLAQAWVLISVVSVVISSNIVMSPNILI